MSRYDIEDLYPQGKKLRKMKKCGHEYGYKCCCRGGENSEHVFDLVDELNFRSRRRRGNR